MTGQGAGAGGTPVFGPIYATVDNLCPECKIGDIDLGLGGDGRWEMQWNFVDCGRLEGRKRGREGGKDTWKILSHPSAPYFSKVTHSLFSQSLLLLKPTQ